MWSSIFSIAIGAIIGALLRWQLGRIDTLFIAKISVGTLTANLLGGYLIGVAAAIFIKVPQASQEWRLLIMTGFLGSFTTFSSFSLEMITMLQQGRILWAFTGITLHMLGTLMMTVLGFSTIEFLEN
ncbi:fluoride efflux transporter CrcB [Candidatus Nitrosacidococcus sp. I8]|uniref:fluoride efflux transporter CrcB n=1 Tax=Candidatus Nitrosacidococcus sp. I8 TaxID=2942908 RepID=UPI002225CBBB|nr:fluoride efflux transporter CrcB [Candidatus Nitrosacidococcus sp. I8]CAH9018682.1 Putative fluoride ion transporter CrcB [Candidatus Nitrosacidococcus sp. I8]